MKGQLSVEWMVILAIVLIIVIIAVVSLQPLTPIPDQVNRRVSDQYWADAPIKIRAFGNGEILNLSIQNNMRVPIILQNITLNDAIYTTNTTNLSIGGQVIISEVFNNSAFIPLSVVVSYIDTELSRTETFIGDTKLIVAVTG